MSALAGIEYAGSPGITAYCINAVLRYIQFGDDITSAKILTRDGSHCLLLNTNFDSLVAIKSGFGSGYTGEGSRGFSYILSLLHFYRIDIEELEVDEALFNRVDDSALLREDIDWIDDAIPVRPSRWSDYIFQRDWDRDQDGRIWNRFPCAIPLAVVDNRISDLARNFWNDPDAALLTGYRRLEDAFRRRVDTDTHGTRLFSELFLREDSPLAWHGIDASEQKARANLFTSVFGAHRNPRAHRQSNRSAEECLEEFVLLNHLYRLESTVIHK